jgi:small conductance mechanosensitive channel
MSGSAGGAVGVQSANGTATPAPGGNTTAVGAIEQDLLAAVPFEWGLQERFVVSAVLAVGLFVLGRYLAPHLIERTKALYRTRLPADRIDPWLRELDDTIPFAMTTFYLVRVIQVTLVGVLLLVLLVVWGQTNLAVEAVQLFFASLDRILDVVLSIALIVGAYVAVDLLEEFVDGIAQSSDRLDEHQSEIVFRVLQVVLLVTAGMVMLSIWNVDLGGLLVGAGFLGIVIGMAARQTLGSLLAGFVLMFSKPFEVGDWIEVNDQEGVVTDITIVNTRLENFDGEYVVMPNDVISNSTIINRTRKGRLRVRLEVGVDYGVDPGRASDVAKDAITDLEEVMSVPRPQVVPTSFGDSAIVLELRFWIDKPSSRRRWRAKSAVLQAVYDAFDEADIGIPFPQRVVSGREDADAAGLPEREGDVASEPAED